MGKRYDSPNERYTGFVIMPDYFDWPQMIAWDDSLYRIGELTEQLKEATDEREKTRLRYELLKEQTNGILPMVEEWHIDNLPNPVTRFPATPLTQSAKLAGWLIGIINTIKAGENTIDPFLSVEPGDTSQPQS